MRDGEPCPDCRWATYILSGRPVLVVRCRECSIWYHTNIKVVKRESSLLGPRWVLDVQFNHEYTRDDLNSILRCDCLAAQLYMTHNLTCNQCNIVKEGHTAIHRVQVSRHNTLRRFLATLTKARYDKSRLPAYTLQRRCGAIREYQMAYTTAVPVSESQIARISAYAEKRQRIRHGETHAKKGAAKTRREQSGSDDKATGGGATPEPQDVVRRGSRA